MSPFTAPRCKPSILWLYEPSAEQMHDAAAATPLYFILFFFLLLLRCYFKTFFFLYKRTVFHTFLFFAVVLLCISSVVPETQVRNSGERERCKAALDELYQTCFLLPYPMAAAQHKARKGEDQIQKGRKTRKEKEARHLPSVVHLHSLGVQPTREREKRERK